LTRVPYEIKGDVKRLHRAEPGYRLRVGEYRVLFDLDGAKIVVRRVRHRREVYGP
jgi:mRNA interferase RelE/StbE